MDDKMLLFHLSVAVAVAHVEMLLVLKFEYCAVFFFSELLSDAFDMNYFGVGG
jgi:hypothetical protein